MRYVIAAIGAILIFAAAFFLSAILAAILFGGRLVIPVTIGPFWTDNPVGLILAIAAATASFYGTLRHYKQRDEKKRREPTD